MKVKAKEGVIAMRGSIQVLWYLALLGILLASSLGAWGGASEQQPGDTDMCKPPNKSVTVSSTKDLQNALNDPDCMEIVLTPGSYTLNLILSDRNDLTIKSTRVDNPREQYPVIEGQENNRQTIFIRNSTNVTIAGLKITTKGKGSTAGVVVVTSSNIKLVGNYISGNQRGIDIAGSTNITVRDNIVRDNIIETNGVTYGYGVIIENSTIEGFINNKVENNDYGIQIKNAKGVTLRLRDSLVGKNTRDGIRIISSPVTLQNVTIQGNRGNGIVAEPSESGIPSRIPSQITIEGLIDPEATFRMEISRNTENGIWLKDSTLVIKQSEIFRNGGCGIKVEGGSVVNDPQGPSNWIAANANGNICGPNPEEIEKIKALIKKREIKVPRHVDKIQDAVKDAEPVKGSEAPYTILVGSPADAAAYVESLCIDRSVKLQAEAPLTLKAEGQDKPAIAIALEDCSLNSDESSKPTVITFERSPTAPLDAGWTIEGGLTGVRVGTVHALKNRKDPVYLQVELKDVTIKDQQQAGIEATASGKGNIVKLDVQGSSALVDNKCDPVESALKSTQARRIETGITLASKDEALVKASIKNVQVSSGKGDGIRVVYEGQLPATRGPFEVGADLELRFSVVKSAGQGLTVMSSKGARPELFISYVLVQKNAMGGINLQADPGASLSVRLGYLQIIENENFGAQFRGPMQVVWEEPPITTDERGYKDQCQVINNKGPGVHLEGGASVELSNLKVISNKSSGIMVVGSATTLTLKQSHLSYNQYHGVALQAQESGPRLRATIKNNRIENNRKWGVTQIVRGCVQGVTRSEFYGDVTKDSKENLIFGNGLDLTESEKRAAPNGQVCPEALIYLMEGTQQ
jgi:parallel beta-helix repeat protein